MIGRFFAGVRDLGRGFGYWRLRPGVMALGLIPALIALIVLAAVLVPFFFSLGSLTAWVTPFADGWDPLWATVLRSAIGVVAAIAALVLASVIFTALTLLIGDPFYQRIWRTIETDLGGEVPPGDGSLRIALGESVRLILLGALIALLALVVGLLPVVGTVGAAVLSVLLTGRVLARELTGRALNARDIPTAERSRLFAAHRARLLGFGTATQLCFMLPLGAVFVMPTAVAGATLLARDLLTAGPPEHPPAPAQSQQPDTGHA